MIKQDIINAYIKIRKIDNTIPDEILDFMKDCAVEKLEKGGKLLKHLQNVSPSLLLNYSFRDENSELQFCQVDKRNAEIMIGNMMTKLNEVNNFIKDFQNNSR